MYNLNKSKDKVSLMEKIKVLIVEDNEEISFLIQNFLNGCGFFTNAVYTATDGISYLKNNHYDILLLDLNLPDYNGYDLLSSVRKDIAIPVIVISAYSDLDTKLKAFRYGASDYMVKPIEFLELEARIWALLSILGKIKSDEKVSLFTIEQNNILFKNEIINLTSLEFKILSFFINNQGLSISRDAILEVLPTVNNHRLLDNHIKNIRVKIEPDKSKPIYLKTEYGVGYKFI